jgi:hypothetical protein
VGYIVAAVIVAGGLTVAYLVIGVERTFAPGTFDATPLWMGTMIVVGIIAALTGGLVCRLIAKRTKPVHILAIVFFALGILSAVMSMNRPEPGPRAGNVSSMDAAQKAKEPTWFLFVNPVLGYVGVLIGGGVKKEPPLSNPKIG